MSPSFLVKSNCGAELDMAAYFPVADNNMGLSHSFNTLHHVSAAGWQIKRENMAVFVSLSWRLNTASILCGTHLTVCHC